MTVVHEDTELDGIEHYRAVNNNKGVCELV